MFVLQIQGLTGTYEKKCPHEKCPYEKCPYEKGPYEKGYYHGLLIFPADYPLKPPQIRMLTPSGRFEVNTPLCLQSLKTEIWSPSWTIAYILQGLAN